MIDESGRTRIYVLAGSLLLIATFIAALLIGRYPISLDDVIDFFTGNLDSSSNEYKVIMDLRFPRTIIAALVGVGLSLSGLLYQETFQNKLISPDFLGVTSGASVGAAVALLLGLGATLVGLFAFATGCIAVLTTLSLSKCFQNRSPTILLLSGIIIGGLMAAILSLIKYLADPESTLASITFWLMGSCEHTTMGDVKVLLPIILLCTAFIILIRWRVNIVALGRDEAISRGLNFRLYYYAIILVSTLMTAASTSIVGAIGWIGLVVPHMVRIMVGRNTMNSIPVAVLFGSIFMIIVDILSRSFTDSEIPLSAITGFIGTVVFIIILYVRRRTILERD